MARTAAGRVPPKIGLLSRGDSHTRGQSARADTMLSPLVGAFAGMDVSVEPVVYFDDVLDAVRNQLLGLDGVLVWVNPVQDGVNRSRLAALLQEVAACGVRVSAHPDVIPRMGTKEVLFTTRASAGFAKPTLTASPGCENQAGHHEPEMRGHEWTASPSSR